MRRLRFLDPLYRIIEIAEVDSGLVRSPEFQRLRYVRLCNINSLYLTGASEPARFEHCIGVYHLADIWSSEHLTSPVEKRIIRRAALLHDLKTGPFGHSFQYVLEDNAFDEKFEHAKMDGLSPATFHQRTRRGVSFAGRQFETPEILGADAPLIDLAIRGEGPIGGLISGTLDFDNLDNVVRLAFHMGLCDEADRSLPLSLICHLGLHDGKLLSDSHGHPLIERWFELRKSLYHYLLLDRGEFAAKAMLTLAVEKAADIHIVWPDLWVLTDDELFDYLEKMSIGEGQIIGQIIKRLKIGDLFSEIEVWTSRHANMYEQLCSSDAKRTLEAEIASQAVQRGAHRLKVCLHYIKDFKKTCRAVTFFNSSTGQWSTIGTDSHALHVGLFIANDREDPNSRTLQTYREVAERILRNAGLPDLRFADDPMSTPSEETQAQRALL